MKTEPRLPAEPGAPGASGASIGLGALAAAGRRPAAGPMGLADAIAAAGDLLADASCEGLSSVDVVVGLRGVARLRSAVDAAEARLVGAGAELVDASERLLSTAKRSNPERTRRSVGDWVREHMGGLTEVERYETQRKLRSMTFGQTDEGLLRATMLMDPAGGAGLRALVDDTAQRFFETDRAEMRKRKDAPEPRTFTQCRVDALESLLGINKQRARQRFFAEDPLRIWDRIDDPSKKSPRPAPMPPMAGEHQAGLPAAGGTDSVGDCFEAASKSIRPRNQVVIVADAKSVLGDDNADIHITDTGPQWCEAHHVIPWQAPAKGPTDIDNLALLCNRCHKQLHDTGARLRQHQHGIWSIDHDFQRVRHRRRDSSEPGRRHEGRTAQLE